MNATDNEMILDARDIPARMKHPTIFKTWTDLADGGAIQLVNDHDPLPLYYQFACEHTGQFHWEYLENGPQVWRVRITKGVFADPGFTPARKTPAPACCTDTSKPLVLDVRPVFARGETPCASIDEAAGQVAPGQTLVLLVPFEPVPLYAKFGREGFTHQSRQVQDGSWRIEFLRKA